MEGFLTRVISIILAFLMLIAAPLINTYGVQDMENRIELLNDVSDFLDKQTDKHAITEYDLNQFYLDAESHGMTVDVEVSRYTQTTTTLQDGTIKTLYIVADDISSLNTHDILQVKVTEVSTTPYKKLLNIFLKIYDEPYEVELAKMVT